MKENLIIIKEDFKDDYISREAGEKLRNIIISLDKNYEGIEIDFSGITIASTSFFDEAFAKLVDYGWNRNKLFKKVSMINIDPRDEIVLEKMLENRKML